MVFTDADGFPINSTKDGMDSSMRMGIMILTGMNYACVPRAYEISPGLLTRHPKHFPSNNPYNFTRDQLLPLIAGFNYLGNNRIIGRVLFKTLKRGCFAQNFERDIPGTRKYPWPHYFTNDRGVQEFSWGDFADPIFPSAIGAMILGSKAWSFYWMLPVCYLFHILSILGSISHGEVNQIISECSFYGKWSFKLFAKVNPDWKKRNHEYWYNRNEGEYADSIEKYVEGKL